MGGIFASGRVVCGTRQFGYLCSTARRFSEKHREYYILREGRRRHAFEGRTAFNHAYWTHLGQVLASMYFIFFVAGLEDILEACQPHTMRVPQLS